MSGLFFFSLAPLEEFIVEKDKGTEWAVYRLLL